MSIGHFLGRPYFNANDRSTHILPPQVRTPTPQASLSQAPESSTQVQASVGAAPSLPESVSAKGAEMAEVRVRPARKAGKLNFGEELKSLLYAHGDDHEPLEETIRVLDDITTDFIIESCHGAAQIANYAGRQKVKVDDFRMLFRKDAHKLGRMLELENVNKDMIQKRKLFDLTNDRVEKGMAVAEELGAMDSDDEDSHVGGGEGVGAKKKKRAKKDDGQGKGKMKEKET